MDQSGPDLLYLVTALPYSVKCHLLQLRFVHQPPLPSFHSVVVYLSPLPVHSHTVRLSHTCLLSLSISIYLCLLRLLIRPLFHSIKSLGCGSLKMKENTLCSHLRRCSLNILRHSPSSERCSFTSAFCSRCFRFCALCTQPSSLANHLLISI